MYEYLKKMFVEFIIKFTIYQTRLFRILTLPLWWAKHFFSCTNCDSCNGVNSPK